MRVRQANMRIESTSRYVMRVLKYDDAGTSTPSPSSVPDVLPGCSQALRGGPKDGPVPPALQRLASAAAL